MRLFWKVTGIALLALGLAGNPSEAAMRLKAGHILPPTSDQGQAAEFFARRVKELTKGEIEAMMKRRDVLVRHFEKLIAERGEVAVFFTLSPAAAP